MNFAAIFLFIEKRSYFAESSIFIDSSNQYINHAERGFLQACPRNISKPSFNKPACKTKHEFVVQNKQQQHLKQ